MNLDNIPEKSQQLMNKVANAVEKTGKEVATQVSNITDGKPEEVTNEAIQAAVDQAVDVLEVASQKVQEKDINGERVTIHVAVNILQVVELRITTDVPAKDTSNTNNYPNENRGLDEQEGVGKVFD